MRSITLLVFCLGLTAILASPGEFRLDTPNFLKFDNVLKMTATEMEQNQSGNAIIFTLGFFDGMNSVLGLQPFSPCVVMNFQVVQQMEVALKFIATGKASSIAQGLVILGQALQSFPNAIQQCQGAQADVKILISALQVIKNPEIVVKDAQNIILNGARISQAINQAVAAEQAKDYSSLGNAIGQIVALASTRQPKISTDGSKVSYTN